MPLEGLGKLLLVTGALLALMGLVLLFAGRIPLIGKLPGDIVFRKGGFTFYLPLVTMLLLSILLTVVFNLVSRLFR